MNKTILTITIFVLVSIIALLFFIYFALPLFNSPAAAGIIGVVIGSFMGLLGAMASSIVGIWKATKDVGDKLKDRISNYALELTKLDYELRQKSLDSNETKQLFLAPVKVYRTFYKALHELHTAGNWPKEPEELGLLNIFELGQKR
jgi:hypothetical protein